MLQPKEVKPIAKWPGKIFFGCCTVGMAFIIWFRGGLYFYGKELRFPGEDAVGFMGMMAGGLFLGILFCLGSCRLLYYAICDRRLSALHLAGLVCMAGLFFVPTGDLYLEGVKKRLLPIKEADSISFATQVRASFGTEANSYVSLRDLEYAPGTVEKRRAEAFLKILERSVFADWPREMLTVLVQPESVHLTRGSGMLGRIGIEILDQGTPSERDRIPEPPANPYGAERDQLSSRVFFIRGD